MLSSDLLPPVFLTNLPVFCFENCVMTPNEMTGIPNDMTQKGRHCSGKAFDEFSVFLNLCIAMAVKDFHLEC